VLTNQAWGSKQALIVFWGDIWIAYFNLDSSCGPSPRLVGFIAPPLAFLRPSLDRMFAAAASA
jgi:hypothetical protein